MFKSTIGNTQDALYFQWQSKPKQPDEAHSGLGNAYGNQALLQMKRATRISPVTPMRPSQTPVLQRKCTECEEEEKLQRKPNGSADHASATVPPIVHEVLSTPGQSLDAETLEFMEPRLGHQLSEVRIHIDSKAAESAKRVHASAYTVGNNVVFGAGQYAPGTLQGKKLLAHELTHVVQQSASTASRSLRMDSNDSPAEREAHDVSNRIVAGNELALGSGTIGRFSSVQPLMQREEIDEDSPQTDTDTEGNVEPEDQEIPLDTNSRKKKKGKKKKGKKKEAFSCGGEDYDINKNPIKATLNFIDELWVNNGDPSLSINLCVSKDTITITSSTKRVPLVEPPKKDKPEKDKPAQKYLFHAVVVGEGLKISHSLDIGEDKKVYNVKPGYYQVYFKNVVNTEHKVVGEAKIASP